MGERRAGGWAAMVAIAVLVASCGGDSDTGEPSLPGAAWTRIRATEDTLGGPGAQGMRGVTVGGPGLVAVGSESVDGDSDAAAWISADGLTWTRVPHDEANLGGRNGQTMRAVVAGGPGLVAVGYESSGQDSDAAVWTSVDGSTWTRVPHDEAVFGGDWRQAMQAVVTGGPGLVAVGYDESNAGRDDAGGRATDAAVWTSADGSIWTRVPHDEAVFGGDNSRAMTAVVVGGPGLVAVGYDSANQGWAGMDANAAVWTSPDGIAWTRVPNAEVFGDRLWQIMNAVTRGGPGLVAVGHDGAVNDYDAAVWTSTDGIIWTRVLPDEAVFGGSDVQEMSAVAAADSGLVAVGYRRGAGGYDAAVWASVDGLTWIRVSPDRTVFGGLGSQGASGVVAGGPGFVAVGHSMAIVGWVPRDGDAAVWTSPPPSPSEG
jgi:hypothetical protein